MSTESLRNCAMDAQRYDLSSRRKPSTLTISTAATRPHCDKPSQDGDLYVESPTTLLGESWDGHAIAVLSTSTSLSEEEIPSSTVTNSGRYMDESSTSSSSSTLVVSNTTFTQKKETHSTDVFEHEGYITTRTIIRPTPSRSNIFALFSRPSLESLASRPTSRPTSPLGIRLGNLNCMGSTDAFEEELDFIQQEREKHLAGVNTALRVRINQDRNVLTEELWRDAVQSILYERAPGPVDSVIGHVAVY